jgi:RNA polymerase sigma factor (sigma-70 family)
LTGVESFEAVYRTVGPKLWRSLLAYASDAEVASDALAEAFAQAIARGPEIRSPEPWLWTAAFRIAAGELSKRRASMAPVPEASEPSYEMPVPAEHLIEALSALSANQRVAVVMHDYADRPTSEVAEALGVTVATVHVHLSRGRRHLRRMLEEQDG